MNPLIDYWKWQGDGYDHLESLVCPVLIDAKDLKVYIDALKEVAKMPHCNLTGWPCPRCVAQHALRDAK